jgi:hypothetical protein
VLLDAFFDALAEKLGEGNRLRRDRLERDLDLLPSTQALIQGERKAYGTPDLAFGAQLALEWQAYTMLRKLYDGARNYLDLWSIPDEFHEACEYYYAHIGAAEKDHKDESLLAVRRYTGDAKRLTAIQEGYDHHLDLIAGFWQGLHQATLRLAA